MPLILWALFIALMVKSVYAFSYNEIRVGVSFSIPPYVIQAENKGIELDILTESLKSSGYRIKPLYMPFSRSFHLFEKAKLDAVLNVKVGAVTNAYYSNVVIEFENDVITLEKNKWEFTDVSQLSDKKVVSFAQATALLGREFKNAMENNKQYQTVEDQRAQLRMLFAGRIDAIVMDKNIFYYYFDKLSSDLTKNNYLNRIINVDQKTTFHGLFPPTPYRFAFKSEKVRDDFNLGLKKIKDSGEYDAIFTRYINPIVDPVLKPDS